MQSPIIRVFPHSRDEFPTADDLRTWLATALKAKGGRYLLHSLTGIGEGNTPPGSIGLFRFHDEIVGEAVVVEDVQRAKIQEPSGVGGNAVTYEGFIQFVPSSIRLYVGGLAISDLQAVVGTNLQSAQTRNVISDWSVYPAILRLAARQGFA
ncbi:MAG: hypothetical protein Q8P50_12700 [Bacillota bacterium]|nr:hypothetical protein [Bacillota bacterium]